jgi:poly(A) polymerase
MTLPHEDDIKRSRRAFAIEVVHRLREHGYQALWAGGCVRDLLLGLTPWDYDVATDATPERVMRIFPRTVPDVGVSFGVVRVLGPAPAVEIEVATFRSDGRYVDGRRPLDVRFGSPEEDAARRDFTINGMFLDPITGDLLDFVGGQDDLWRGLIRAIGDPRARFEEDKLRLVRAVRFAARLGFPIEAGTRQALLEMAPSISVVAAERIAQELKRMLLDPSRAEAMKLLRETRLLQAILPLLAPLLGDDQRWEHTLRVLDALGASAPPSFSLAFAALVHAIGEPSGGMPPTPSDPASAAAADQAARSLRLSNAERERIAWIVGHQHALRTLFTFSIPERKRLMAHEAIGDLLELLRAEVASGGANPETLARVESYLANLPEGPLDPPPFLNGADLKSLGLQPGPAFKRILDEARDRQLDGSLTSRKDALEWASKQAHDE